jgi:formamidopyrimidine-DNA glycosylase
MAKNHFKNKKTRKRNFSKENAELQSIIKQLKEKGEINKNVLAVVSKTGKMLCIHANNEEKTVIYHNCMIMSDRFRIEV